MSDRSNLIVTILVDLDSTLCGTQHRHHLAPEDHINGDWVAFSNACLGDSPIVGSIQTVRLLYPTNRIVICSGRNHTAIENTRLWLEREQVPYDEMFLCNYDELGQITNGEYKVMQIAEQRRRGFDPVLFIEDYPPSAEMIEAAGVPVLCINPRYRGNNTKEGPGEYYVLR